MSIRVSVKFLSMIGICVVVEFEILLPETQQIELKILIVTSPARHIAKPLVGSRHFRFQSILETCLVLQSLLRHNLCRELQFLIFQLSLSILSK
jgi:hypothetical protein